MNSIPKRKNPMIIAAAGGLLSITMGATTSYAASGMVASLTDFDINETIVFKKTMVLPSVSGAMRDNLQCGKPR